MKTLYNIIIVIMIILISYLVTISILQARNKLSIQQNTYYNYAQQVDIIDLTQQQAIEMIKAEFKLKLFNLTVVDNLNGANGKTCIVTRMITIEKMSGWQTLWVLAHEMTHLKYVTKNETWTNFKTWQTLYESNNKVLKQRAEYAIKEYCQNGYLKNTEYDISYYIVKYLTK